MEKSHTEDAVAEKKKLAEQSKQLMARIIELEREVVKGKEIVADPSVELKETEKSAIWKERSASSIAVASTRLVKGKRQYHLRASYARSLQL